VSPPPSLTDAEIESPDGKMLYNMADKMLAIRKTTVAEDDRKREVLKVTKKWSPGSKLTATAVDKTDRELTLVLNGDMYGVSANIELKDGTPLAHISRKLVTATDMVADKQTVSLLEGAADSSTTSQLRRASTSRSWPPCVSASTRP
jgi:uncharacterized protein YxjI